MVFFFTLLKMCNYHLYNAIIIICIHVFHINVMFLQVWLCDRGPVTGPVNWQPYSDLVSSKVRAS